MAAEEPTRFRVEDGGFLGLLLVVTVMFGFVVAPFFGAILWALVLAILFNWLNRRVLERMPERKNGAALITLTLITLIVILPAIFLGVALAQEVGHFYELIQSGQIDIPSLFGKVVNALPSWASEWLRTKGWTDFTAVQDAITNSISGSAKVLAGQALLVGQGAFNLFLMLSVMLYLTFFLLRDGDALGTRVVNAIPLHPDRRNAIVQNFTVVIRATIKGSVVVAIVQGLIGGVTFWALGIEGALLWGVVMGFFSLIPAVGTGIVWIPVAIYLFAVSAYVKAFILVFCGVFIIGMVDNVLRPILVGRDTRMPDYVVLISTLGGLQVFGFNGFVIGPVVAAMFIATWNILTQARNGSSGPATSSIGARSQTEIDNKKQVEPKPRAPTRPRTRKTQAK